MPQRHIRVGDEIAVPRSGHSPRDPSGAGLVLEVLGREGDETYRVRWIDGRETFYRAGGDVRVKRRSVRA